MPLLTILSVDMCILVLPHPYPSGSMEPNTAYCAVTGGNQMDVQANMRKQQQWSPAMQQQMKPDGGMQQISPNMQPMQPGMGWQMQGGSRGLRVSQGSGMMASEAPGMMSMQGQRQGGQMGMQGESPNLQMNNEGE